MTMLELLWFAFIFLSLSYWQQLYFRYCVVTSCCDLLSFSYLCRTDNNYFFDVDTGKDVVICFHFPIFVVLTTTSTPRGLPPARLWFAFIFLSLSYWQQPMPRPYNTPQGCDLLSFSYLCRTDNNPISSGEFQESLWFAFIFLSLSYWQQQIQNYIEIQYSCDLLSFSYLCRTDNNKTSSPTAAAMSCDLLSFSYLCRTDNNFYPYQTCEPTVVICFHFPIFVVLTTTALLRPLDEQLLWFAFIFLSLSYWQQPLLYLVRIVAVVICFHFPIFVVLTTTLIE